MTKLFLSYSHKDEPFRNELEVHLAALQKHGVIDVWHDRKLNAGSEFDNAIKKELEDSDIILLLISQYFIASEYCYAVEMTRALQKHAEHASNVVVSSCH